MHPLWRILLGFAIMALGFFMVKNTPFFQDFTGTIDWAEQKLGGGGTNSFLKILGVVIAFIGIAVVTNSIAGVLQSFANIFVR